MPRTEVPIVPAVLPTITDLPLSLLGRPIFVYDLDRRVFAAANPAALRLFGLAAADMGDVGRLMDDSIATRIVLSDYRDRLSVSGGTIDDRWTFFPPVRSMTLDCRLSAVVLEDGRIGLMFEAAEIEAGDREDRRAVEVLHHIRTMVWLYDCGGDAVFRNPAAMAAFGGAQHRFVDRFVDRAEGAALWQASLAGATSGGIYRVATLNGARWHGLDVSPIRDPVTGDLHVLVNERDVTRIKTIEQKLRDRERQLITAQEIGGLGDWRYDPQRRVFEISTSLAAIYELDHLTVHADEVNGLLPEDERGAVRAQFLAAFQTGEVYDLRHRIVTRSGMVRHVAVRGAVFTDEATGEREMIGILRDVSDEVRARERIEHLALHDTVTGLANRAQFVDRLGRAMGGAESCGALILVDLDGFKDINDTRGHAAGDAVLKEIGVRLMRLARAGDVVARLGGDEFALILPDLVERSSLERRTRELLAALSAPILVEGAFVSVGASIGVSRWPEDGRDPESLQRNADLALYSAKGEGGEVAHFFSRAMRLAVEERRRLLDDLRHAIERRQLDVYFQPLVELEKRRVAGFEALVRWEHPNWGVIPPDSFVPIAESSGLMQPLGAQVLHTALGQIRQWLDEGLEPGTVAVNLGADQLRGEDLVGLIADTLAAFDLPAWRLEIEVTETVTLGRRAAEVVALLERLHDLGVRIVLDDFGTGHASLTHLKRLPVDRLKIDRSFVADIERDASNAAIVKAVLGLGRSLSVSVVAEGVETPAQVRFLRQHGCDVVQGYLFGKPMPREEAGEWLRSMRFAAIAG